MEQGNMKENQHASDDSSAFGFGLSVVCIITSPCIFALQIYTWLRTGEWLSLPLWRTLNWLGVPWEPLITIEGWAGVSKIFLLLLDISTALTFLFVGFLVIVLNPR